MTQPVVGRVKSRSPVRSGRASTDQIASSGVNLIKVMISPIIFCTIVLGIGSVVTAAKVGRVGLLATATS